MEIKIPWSIITEKEGETGETDTGIDRKKASDHYYHEQFVEGFFSASYSKWDDDRAWSSQEWKINTEIHVDRGDPMKLLGERHDKLDLVSLTRKHTMMEPRNPL